MEDFEYKITILPNGEVALATRVTEPEKGYLMCWQCKTHLVYEREARQVRCAVCQAINGTTIDPSGTVFVLFKCGVCQTLQRAQRNAVAVKCAHCNSVSELRP